MNFFERQNHKQALTYLRAANYCDKRKKRLSYMIIMLPVIMTLLSIVNGNLSRIVPNADTVEIWKYSLPEFSELLAKFIVIFSGVLIVFEVFVNIKVGRLDIENANFLERFDNYVFDLPVNEAYLHPIPEQAAESYAYKTSKKQSFENFYFESKEDAERKNACFTNIKNQFEFEYKLMIYVKPLFIFIWVGYCLFLFGMAFVLDFALQDAIINIFIPALATISIIVESWHTFNEKLKQLTTVNLLITRIEKGTQPNMTLGEQSTLRSLQDALFSYRIDDFYIPEFLVWLYGKHAAAASWRDQEGLPEKPSKKHAKETTKMAALEIRKKNPHRKTTTVKSAKKTAKPAQAKIETKPEIKAEIKPEPKIEVKPEPKVEAKPEVKAEVKKPEVKAEAKKPEVKAVAKKTEAKKAETKVEPKKKETTAKKSTKTGAK